MKIKYGVEIGIFLFLALSMILFVIAQDSQHPIYETLARWFLILFFILFFVTLGYDLIKWISRKIRK